MLRERRALAAEAAIDATLARARMEREVAALRTRMDPCRASLTVVAGLSAGFMARLLPWRLVFRVGTLALEASTLARRLWPDRTRSGSPRDRNPRTRELAS
jgi:hypothetical protein